MVDNMSITISLEAKNWMEKLAGPLREFYCSSGKSLSQTDLTMEIERRFGEQIVKEVCIPHGLSQGVCLLIAAEVAKEEPKAAT